MASKSKSTGHSKSKTPSPSPQISRKHSKSPDPKQEVANKIIELTVEIPKNPDHSCSTEALEVQSLIHKLQGISLFQEESELSQYSVTSQFTPSQRLTRA